MQKWLQQGPEVDRHCASLDPVWFSVCLSWIFFYIPHGTRSVHYGLVISFCKSQYADCTGFSPWLQLLEMGIESASQTAMFWSSGCDYSTRQARSWANSVKSSCLLKCLRLVFLCMGLLQWFCGFPSLLAGTTHMLSTTLKISHHY